MHRPLRSAVLVGVLALGGAGCTAGHPSQSSEAAAPLAVGPAVASPGCALAGASAETLERRDLTVGDSDRWYLLTTPAHPRPHHPVPLVVDLHGSGEGARLQATTSQFGAKAASTGFMAAFPEGTGTPVEWTINASVVPNPDITFMKEMLGAVEADQCVDTSRVYVTGISEGAFMTSLLACTMAGTFAAFAPVAGVYMPHPCHPARAVPIVAFHGTADPIVLFNGGLGQVTIPHTPGPGPTSTTTRPPPDLSGQGIPLYVKEWAAFDRCGSSPSDRHVSAHVILRTYPCPKGAAVELYIVLGGGHAWPGSRVSAALASITGPSTFEVNATDVIWRFFEHYRLADARP